MFEFSFSPPLPLYSRTDACRSLLHISQCLLDINHAAPASQPASQPANPQKGGEREEKEKKKKSDPTMTAYANSSFMERKDTITVPSTASRMMRLAPLDPDGITQTFWWTPPTALATSSHHGLSTLPGAVVSHPHASPPVLSSPSPSLPAALLSSTTLAATTLPVLTPILQTSSLAVATTAAGGTKVVVVVTTTVAAHLSATATLTPTPAYSKPPDWTPSYTAFVVMASLSAGVISLVVVWCLWQRSRNKPDVSDMEGGMKRLRLPETVAAGQRSEETGYIAGAGRGWSILGEGEVGGGERQGISRSATASCGNPASCGSVSDGAGDHDSSSSSYISAVEYNGLDGESIHSNQSTTPSSYSETGGPLNRTSLLRSPPSSNPGQTLINPFEFQLPLTISTTAVSASDVGSNCIWETRALGGSDFVSPRRHPLSGDDTTSPVFVLEHKATGHSVRGVTGPGERVGQRSVPQITGSLQERLLGKYPARWG